jgi:hypothetical protein
MYCNASVVVVNSEVVGLTLEEKLGNCIFK